MIDTRSATGRLAIAGAAVLTLWLLLGLLAPWLAPADPTEQIFDRLVPPSGDNWFGTDSLGRDLLSRTLYAARVSLPLAVILVACASLIGSMVGAIAGYFGGKLEGAIMRITDLFFSFPKIVLAMAIVTVLGRGVVRTVLALVIVAWPSYARVVRSVVLSVRQSDYVKSARLLGANAPTVLIREVVPNTAGPIAVLATLELGNAVLLLAGLSFLGLGVQPPTPEWGAMVAEGARYLSRWWVALFPGLAIVSVVLAFNLLGDALRDRIDPKLAKRME